MGSPKARRRALKLALAAHVATQLNDADPAPQYARLIALADARPRFAGVDVDPATGKTTPLGYERITITALRRYGRATIYFHGRSRTFRTKVDTFKRARQARPLLIDEMVKISGLVARCSACPRFYVLTDRRRRYCSPTCSARDRQRRRRRQLRLRSAKGHAQARALYETHAREKAARRAQRNDGAIAAAYTRDLYDTIGDRIARGAQRAKQHSPTRSDY
jgi:hypothetical protein